MIVDEVMSEVSTVELASAVESTKRYNPLGGSIIESLTVQFEAL
jgi:hypothetical protein